MDEKEKEKCRMILRHWELKRRLLFKLVESYSLKLEHEASDQCIADVGTLREGIKLINSLFPVEKSRGCIKVEKTYYIIEAFGRYNVYNDEGRFSVQCRTKENAQNYCAKRGRPGIVCGYTYMVFRSLGVIK